MTESSVERYYRHQAPVYDYTRWIFLFGRTEVLRHVAASRSPSRILEVGCGTGRNLVELNRLFPLAQITGLDASSAMLERARRKVERLTKQIELVCRRYDHPVGIESGFDLILFSYSLSMFNNGFAGALDSALLDLAQGGRIAVVDFHDSNNSIVTRWLKMNHVLAVGQLRPLLGTSFRPVIDDVHPAYGGAWRYLTFIGERPEV